MAEPTPSAAPSWATVLALLSTVSLAACGSDPVTPSGAGHTTEPGHPCYGKPTCSTYVQLPDDAAAPYPTGDAAVPDGGVIRICGPCNG